MEWNATLKWTFSSLFALLFELCFQFVFVVCVRQVCLPGNVFFLSLPFLCLDWVRQMNMPAKTLTRASGIIVENEREWEREAKKSGNFRRSCCTFIVSDAVFGSLLFLCNFFGFFLLSFSLSRALVFKHNILHSWKKSREKRKKNRKKGEWEKFYFEKTVAVVGCRFLPSVVFVVSRLFGATFFLFVSELWRHNLNVCCVCNDKRRATFFLSVLSLSLSLSPLPLPLLSLLLWCALSLCLSCPFGSSFGLIATRAMHWCRWCGTFHCASFPLHCRRRCEFCYFVLFGF